MGLAPMSRNKEIGEMKEIRIASITNYDPILSVQAIEAERIG
jgi:hypothetical protein